jgi:single-stranded-DNA-specific exonuclease
MTLTPRICIRPQSPAVFQAARDLGYTELQARLLAARLPEDQANRVHALVRPSLSQLSSPSQLPDIEPAVEAIVAAILDGRPLVCCSDFDADGLNSSTVVLRALRDFLGVPAERIRHVTAHRQRDGYGVSSNVADRMIAELPGHSLVITCDQGSSDQTRIERLVQASHVVVVTDHHGLPAEGPPRSAVACVNPVRPDSPFGDPYISGCVVALLVMAAVRQRLLALGHLPPTAPKLTPLVAFAGTSVIADCVSLGLSVNNRALVIAALSQINAPDAFPCWRAFREATGLQRPVTSQDLAFLAVPMINASSRVAHADAGLAWLMADDDATALAAIRVLQSHNEERKATERAMVTALRPHALALAANGAAAVCLLDPEGSQGVMGIAAARLVEATGRPSAVFVGKLGQPDVISGSFRSVPGVNIRHALAQVDAACPHIFAGHGYGGHAGAAGAHFPLEHYADFVVALENAVRDQVDPSTLMPTTWVDADPQRPFTLDMLAELAVLEPFGRGFELPCFCLPAQVASVKVIGQDRTHLRLELLAHGRSYEAVWFRAMETGQPPPVQPGDRGVFAVEPGENAYRGQIRLQLLVRQAALS